MAPKNKNKKLGRFAKFIIIYSCTAFVVMIAVWGLLYAFLGDYEEGRPSVAMDKIISDFNAENVDKVLSSAKLTTNEFETIDLVTEFLKSRLTGQETSYKKSNGEYSEATPVYIVYAGDAPLARVELTDAGKNFFKFTKWQLGSISTYDISPKTPSKTVTVTVPSGSEVSLNGISVDTKYIKNDNITFDPCKNVAEFVTAPTLTEYEVTGLLCEPDITVEYNNMPLSLSGENGVYTCSYPEDAALLETQKATIINTAETYGKYIINRGSLASLKKLMVGRAETYISDIPAVWAFLSGKQYTYEFKNESITNFKKYSDNCFSCDMYYDLYVNWGYGSKTYETSMTYVYVLIDGNWYVADFVIN